METQEIFKIVGVAVGIVIWGWSGMRKQARKQKELQRADRQSVVEAERMGQSSWSAEEEPVRAEGAELSAVSEIVAPAPSSEEVGGTVEGAIREEEQRRERVAMDLRTMIISSELLKPKFEEF